MKIKINRRQRVVISILVLLVTSVAVMTLAFFNSTDVVTNRITSKEPPKILLNEPNWYSEGEDLAKQYVPDVEIPKDPYVTNISEYDVYVRMKLEILDEYGKVITDTDTETSHKQLYAILNSIYMIDDSDSSGLVRLLNLPKDEDETSEDENEEEDGDAEGNDNGNDVDVDDGDNEGDGNGDNEDNGDQKPDVDVGDGGDNNLDNVDNPDTPDNGNDEDKKDGEDDSKDEETEEQEEVATISSNNPNFFYREEDGYFYYGTITTDTNNNKVTTLTPLAPNGSTSKLFDYVVTPDNNDLVYSCDEDGNTTFEYVYDLYFSKPFSIKVSAEAIYVLSEQEETFDEICDRFDRS